MGPSFLLKKTLVRLYRNLILRRSPKLGHRRCFKHPAIEFVVVIEFAIHVIGGRAASPVAQILEIAMRADA